MRIAVISNTSWYLYNFRLNLMRALQSAGHEVVAIGADDSYVAKIEKAGIHHRVFEVSGAGMNPLKELVTLLSLVNILRRERIDLVLSNTPKGNIYAAFAAWPLGLRTLANVSGLGRVFIKPSFLTILVKWLYRLAFLRCRHVFFQNDEDMAFFLSQKLVRPDQSLRLPGSGVDLSHFTPAPIANDGRFTFLLIARLLWDKGVGEFVQAARDIRQDYPNTCFQLLGQLDAANPAAIPRQTVVDWQAEGVIEYLGMSDDVRPYIKAAHCVVLPSYREGTPRSLLEAASMARPVITTDAVGCRNVVDDRLTGFLCRPKSADDLADKMRLLLGMSAADCQQMGLRGRAKMEREFDERTVLQIYLRTIESCSEPSGFSSLMRPWPAPRISSRDE